MVGSPLSEAMTHAKHLSKGKEDALSLKRKAVLPLSYVTPTPALLKRQKTVYHELGFVDVFASSITSPFQSGFPGIPLLSKAPGKRSSGRSFGFLFPPQSPSCERGDGTDIVFVNGASKLDSRIVVRSVHKYG